MTTEEKAKAYDEAIKRAKNIHKDAIDMENNMLAKTCEVIFPELKESEDEKIRKRLITYFQNLTGGWFNDISHDDIIAWLERQGEHKVEPKFKVGDWVIRSAEGFKHNIYLVTEVKDYYVCEYLNGRRVTFTFNDVHENFKLWDISDAKDGDMLVCESGERTLECLFIFKLIADREVHEYCSYRTIDKHFSLKDSFLGYVDNVYHPASQEQRDLFFKKMKEAGYEWDDEKKELKKIDNETEIPFGAKDSELQEVTYYIPKGFHAEIDGDKVTIKKGEKPIAWSEEDSPYYDDICEILINFLHSETADVNKDVVQKDLDWLKSIKERYTWEPSEEQIRALEYIIDNTSNVSFSCNIVKGLLKQLKKQKGE